MKKTISKKKKYKKKFSKNINKHNNNNKRFEIIKRTNKYKFLGGVDIEEGEEEKIFKKNEVDFAKWLYSTFFRFINIDEIDIEHRDAYLQDLTAEERDAAIHHYAFNINRDKEGIDNYFDILLNRLKYEFEENLSEPIPYYINICMENYERIMENYERINEDETGDKLTNFNHMINLLFMKYKDIRD